MPNDCPKCKQEHPDKGRAMDGRRAYRCRGCGTVWTNGMQGRKKRYSTQRQHNQFHDTGAARF